jgi:hypothetical protein
MDKGKIVEFDSPSALKSMEGKKSCLLFCYFIIFETAGIYSELFKASGNAAETWSAFRKITDSRKFRLEIIKAASNWLTLSRKPASSQGKI